MGLPGLAGELGEIRRALEEVARLLEAVGLVWAAYAYLVWLIPTAVVMIMSSVRPPVPQRLWDAAQIGVWAVAVPAILLSYRRRSVHLQAAYPRSLSAARGRGFERVLTLGWGVAPAWYVVLPLAAGHELGALTAPLSVLAFLATGVTANAVGELLYFGSRVSLAAALVLYASIALLLLAPLSSPRGVAMGGLVLSYTLAATLYVAEALRLAARRRGPSGGAEAAP